MVHRITVPTFITIVMLNSFGSPHAHVGTWRKMFNRFLELICVNSSTAKESLTRPNVIFSSAFEKMTITSAAASRGKICVPCNIFFQHHNCNSNRRPNHMPFAHIRCFSSIKWWSPNVRQLYLQVRIRLQYTFYRFSATHVDWMQYARCVVEWEGSEIRTLLTSVRGN